MSGAPPPQPGTAGTDDDPLDIETDVLELLNNATGVNTVENLVGVAADSTNTDGTLVYPTANGAQGVPTDLAVRIDGVDRPVTSIEYADATGTLRPVTEWHLGPLGAFELTLDSLTSVQPATFDVGVASTTSPVQPGGTLDVTVDVTNTGDETGAQTVTLSIDNGVGQVDSTSVTLSGGGSVTKTLSWSVPSGQTKQDYQATVSSSDGTASQTVTVSSVPPSLVSRWTFDSAGTNSGTAVDVVGSNDGTIQGATTGVAGLAGYDSAEAYDFDGTDDNVAFGNNALGSLNGQAMSVAAWFNADSVPSSGSGLIYSQEGVITLNVEDANGGELQAFVTATKDDSVSTAINTDTTYHAVLTYDGSGTQALYLDGSQVDSQSGISMFDLSSLDRQVRVGAQYDNSGNFDGVIDDARIYSKELTSTEVSNLYNNGRI